MGNVRSRQILEMICWVSLSLSAEGVGEVVHTERLLKVAVFIFQFLRVII